MGPVQQPGQIAGETAALLDFAYRLFQLNSHALNGS
jgi:hypothetical protein